MTIEKMREKLMFGSKYNGPNWQLKVKDMPDSQIVAIYNNFKKSGMFRKSKKNKEPYHQITIFEYLAYKENKNE